MMKKKQEIQKKTSNTRFSQEEENKLNEVIPYTEKKNEIDCCHMLDMLARGYLPIITTQMNRHSDARDISNRPAVSLFRFAF